VTYGEYLWCDDQRCRVLVPLGSGHPSLMLALLRLGDGARLLFYTDGTRTELPA
jgi:hypothetical protein